MSCRPCRWGTTGEFDPKENLRAFTPSIAWTEMNTARYAALPHPNAEPRGRNARAAADCARACG